MKIFNNFVIFLIVGLRPLFGQAHCKYSVSCTQFATEQLQTNSLLPAVWAIVKRVFSCNPLF
jgi:putative component of membrane protein insertase Oxa1/YidC/SpoIIIJ protein YidD